jgi:hypothetical protein
MFNFIDTLHIFIPVSGCVGRGPSALLCPGAYNAVKTALVWRLEKYFPCPKLCLYFPMYTPRTLGLFYFNIIGSLLWILLLL